MPYYRNIGNVPPKRHTQHRDEQGRLYYEELMGEEGFSSSSSLLYHRNHPSSIRAVRATKIPGTCPMAAGIRSCFAASRIAAR